MTDMEQRARALLIETCRYCGIKPPPGHMLLAPFTEESLPWLVAIRAVIAALSEAPVADGMGESLAPMPTDKWIKLPDRERSLQCIGDVIAYWIKFVTGESIAPSPDTYLMLPGPDAPPHWPSMGQLSAWLKVLRDRPAALSTSGGDGVEDWQPIETAPK